MRFFSVNKRARLFIPSPASRFYPQVREYLQAKGIKISGADRKLFIQFSQLEIFLARGFDIPKAVARGWGDLGITGLDAVEEASCEVVVLEQLGIRFSEVVLASMHLQSLNELRKSDVIVTEYWKLARSYLDRIGLGDVRLYHVTGAAESYAYLPEVAAVITLKTTGQTLIENGLEVIDTIFHSQACLIANLLSCKHDRELIRKWTQLIVGS